MRYFGLAAFQTHVPSWVWTIFSFGKRPMIFQSSLLWAASVFCIGLVYAQEITVTSPPARTLTKYKIDGFCLSRNPNQVAVVLMPQDASNVDMPPAVTFTVPSSTPCVTTLAGLAAAQNNAATGETGSDVRRWQFRVAKFFVDSGCLPGTTATP